MEHKKVCERCKALKSVLDFYEKPDNADGFRNECKDCMRAVREARKSGGRVSPLERSAIPKDAAPSIKAPKRIPYINGGFLYRPAADASRTELEEFWTKFHMTFVGTDPKGRVALYLFLGFPIPDQLDVMHSPELREQIVKYSHGFGARGWGQLFPWGTLPDACGHDAHATHKAAQKRL